MRISHSRLKKNKMSILYYIYNIWHKHVRNINFIFDFKKLKLGLGWQMPECDFVLLQALLSVPELNISFARHLVETIAIFTFAQLSKGCEVARPQ